MKPILFFMALVVYCFPKASAQTGSIRNLPAVYQTRQGKIDVIHQAIDLKFDWEKRQAYGSTSIVFSTLKPTDQITLDAGMLSIHQITLDGIPLGFRYNGSDKDDALSIVLNRMYQPGETATIAIDYHTNHVNEADPNNIWGSFGKGLRFFDPTASVPNKHRQIWSNGEPEANRYWFPCQDVLGDWRTTELTATVEKPLRVIANGNLVETKENPDGTRTFYYKADQPYPNYLTSIVVGEYVDVQQKSGSTTLHTFGYPDEKTAIEATVERLPDMVQFFSETTGMPYPYKHFTQTVVQDYPFPGLNGNHTSVIQSDNMIDDFRTHADFLYLWDGIESQGLASQWFGNLITPKDWKEIWLNTAFCRYLDGLYTGYKNGHAEFLTYYVNADIAAVMVDWDSGYRHPIVTSHFDDLSIFTADNYAKVRGAMVLRMLRKEIGEQDWHKAFQHYVKKYAGKQVSTEDFQQAIQTATGKDLQWFFDQWVYQMGHPVFEVSKAYDVSKKQLTLTVRQIQKIDPKDPYPQTGFFKGTIDVEIDGKIKTIFIESKAQNTFDFSAAKEPKLVNFDFESVWIKQIRFEKTLEEWLYQLENSTDILAQWNAIDELVKIGKGEKTPKSETEKIIHALRKIISGNSYWRLRGYALVQLRNIQPVPDKNTIAVLLKIIHNDKSWVRAGAINSLGMTKDPQYADLYINAFNDPSDRVINAAASALGKSKSPKAFDALVRLERQPSWKSQSRISTLNGLKELADPRGFEIAYNALADVQSPRWFLATPIWDYPIAAAQTIVALGKADAAFPMILDRFKQSVADGDVNDIFANVVLVTTLADPRGQEVFDLLKIKFAGDANTMQAVQNYEMQFQNNLKK